MSIQTGVITTPAAIFSAATHEGTGRKRGPVPKRRYQKGSFQVQNGKAYTLFYRNVETADGTITTERTRQLIGDLSVMSERAARREHDLFMANVNRRRGSVPAPIRGETFKDAVDAWKKDVAPQLSPATVRQRESYLRIHILPVFAKSATHALDVRSGSSCEVGGRNNRTDSMNCAQDATFLSRLWRVETIPTFEESSIRRDRVPSS